MANLSSFGGGGIKSIQYGTINLNTTTSATATITAVTLGKAVLIPLGSSETSTTDQVRLDLTNSTTVTGTRGSSTGNCTTGFVVVEFY